MCPGRAADDRLDHLQRVLHAVVELAHQQPLRLLAFVATGNVDGRGHDVGGWSCRVAKRPDPQVEDALRLVFAEEHEVEAGFVAARSQRDGRADTPERRIAIAVEGRSQKAGRRSGPLLRPRHGAGGTIGVDDDAVRFQQPSEGAEAIQHPDQLRPRLRDICRLAEADQIGRDRRGRRQTGTDDQNDEPCA